MRGGDLLPVNLEFEMKSASLKVTPVGIYFLSLVWPGPLSESSLGIGNLFTVLPFAGKFLLVPLL